jgi:hypothetical protein
MSQEIRAAELRSKSQKLVDGPLKHVRAAALAAALVPLASICATPASAQTSCANSAGICGVVFNDLNHDGIQEAGEPGLPSVTVTITDGGNSFPLTTDINGVFTTFDVFPGDAVQVFMPVPTGFQISPTPNCSFGVCNGGTLNSGFSVITTTASGTSVNFGFFQSSAANPGTGTIGYWKNHPEAWPPTGVVIAGKTYSIADAIAWLNKVGKDKTTMMFAQLVAAKLSVAIGNDSSCIAPTINAADTWLMAHPVGSNVAGASDAWSGSGMGAQLEQTLDAYNNGQLCAPHRQ